MRNLAQYPITTEEIVECLERLRNEHMAQHAGRCGDMTPSLLSEAIEIVKAGPAPQTFRTTSP